MRIVSLCPSLTETLVDLGRGDALVGVTKFCIHPAEAVSRIAKVGGTKNPDLNAIESLAPDLIFFNEEENRHEDFLQLRDRFRIDVSLPTTVGEVPALLRHVGQLVGAEARAERRALELEAALDRLDRKPKTPFSFAYLIWKNPWMTVGPGTYVADLLARAGGSNAFGDSPERYPQIELEALLEAAPDLVLLPDEPFPFKEAHRVEIAAQLTRGRVELVSGDDCCWHGVRSLRGVELVMSLVDTL